VRITTQLAAECAVVTASLRSNEDLSRLVWKNLEEIIVKENECRAREMETYETFYSFTYARRQESNRKLRKLQASRKKITRRNKELEEELRSAHQIITDLGGSSTTHPGL
jgi:hypothetical protein